MEFIEIRKRFNEIKETQEDEIIEKINEISQEIADLEVELEYCADMDDLYFDKSYLGLKEEIEDFKEENSFYNEKDELDNMHPNGLDDY